MKKILLFPLVLFCYSGFGQNNCKNSDPIITSPTPAGYVDPGVAQTRIDTYRMQKNQVIAGTGHKRNIDSILYSPCGFLQLLQSVTSDSYDGLRIYFGCDTTGNKDLMLIFVPTRFAVKDQYRIHLDDTAHCSIIVGSTNKSISVPDASRYIREFENDQLNYFTTDGQKHYSGESKPPRPIYQESNSLWYDISILNPGIIDPTTKTVGIVTYLRNLINTNAIDSIIVDFGGFEHTLPIDYEYQITLIFNYYQKGGHTVAFMTSHLLDANQLLGKRLDFIIKYLTGGNTDTGVPCPPPPSGQQNCPGASLPQ